MNRKGQKACQSYTMVTVTNTGRGKQTYTKEVFQIAPPAKKKKPVPAKRPKAIEVGHTLKKTMKTKITATPRTHAVVKELTVTQKLTAKAPRPKTSAPKAVKTKEPKGIYIMY